MAAITITSLTGATSGRANRGTTQKRGLAGAAGAIFGGPGIVRSTDDQAAHISGSSAGGVEDTTGFRTKDAWALDGATGGMAGARAEGQLLTKSNSRPTGRTAYLGEGVGGSDVTGSVVSFPGTPVQRAGQRAAAKAYVFEGATGTTGALVDKRTIQRGRVPGAHLGASFTTMYLEDVTGSPTTGAVPTVTGSGLTNKNGRFVSRHAPSISGAAAPNAGSVSIISAVTGAYEVDLHADDITGAANGRKGAEILLVARGTDTDEDGDIVSWVSIDGGTDQSTGPTGITAGTYAAYARWRYAGNAGQIECGPWSLRTTLVVP